LLATNDETLIELTLNVFEPLPIWLRYPTVRARLGEQRRPFGREAVDTAVDAGPVRADVGNRFARNGRAGNVSDATARER